MCTKFNKYMIINEFIHIGYSQDDEPHIILTKDQSTPTSSYIDDDCNGVLDGRFERMDCSCPGGPNSLCYCGANEECDSGTQENTNNNVSTSSMKPKKVDDGKNVKK